MNDHYLGRLFDDLQKEHGRLLNELKSIKVDDDTNKKEQTNQKQIAMLNTMMTTTLKLKNYRKKLAETS